MLNGETMFTNINNGISDELDVTNADLFQIEESTIIANAKAGDSESFDAIAKRYRSLIGFVMKGYSIPASERDDLLQECYIGFLKAVRTYNTDKNASFGTYAVVCVRNSLLTALKQYRKETENLVLSDKIPAAVIASPESLVLSRESTLQFYNRFLVELSDYEKRVFELYLNEMNPNEIANKLCRDPKSVKNAIVRIKQKLGHVLEKAN